MAKSGFFRYLREKVYKDFMIALSGAAAFGILYDLKLILETSGVYFWNSILIILYALFLIVILYLGVGFLLYKVSRIFSS